MTVKTSTKSSCFVMHRSHKVNKNFLYLPWLSYIHLHLCLTCSDTVAHSGSVSATEAVLSIQKKAVVRSWPGADWQSIYLRRISDNVDSHNTITFFQPTIVHAGTTYMWEATLLYIRQQCYIVATPSHAAVLCGLHWQDQQIFVELWRRARGKLKMHMYYNLVLQHIFLNGRF